MQTCSMVRMTAWPGAMQSPTRRWRTSRLATVPRWWRRTSSSMSMVFFTHQSTSSGSKRIWRRFSPACRSHGTSGPSARQAASCLTFMWTTSNVSRGRFKRRLACWILTPRRTAVSPKWFLVRARIRRPTRPLSLSTAISRWVISR